MTTPTALPPSAASGRWACGSGGKVWTLAAWCEMRTDFRTFRLDRMRAITDTGETFKPERGKMLSDYYRTMETREDAAADEAVSVRRDGLPPDQSARRKLAIQEKSQIKCCAPRNWPRINTATCDVEIRWVMDCAIRAASAKSASESVTSVWPVAIA